MTGSSPQPPPEPPPEPRPEPQPDPDRAQPTQTAADAFRVEQALGPYRHALARRLVLSAEPDPDHAARRFLAAASSHGIDPALMWGPFDASPSAKHPTNALEVCLAVIGSGRTATLFLGPPDPRTRHDAHAARVAAARAAIEHLESQRRGHVTLIQALPEPGEEYQITALTDAGLSRIAELDYLRRDARLRVEPVPRDAWPSTAEPRRLDLVGTRDRWSPALLDVLERSYEDTLDCPELCGLRATEDVLASHEAVGQFDPSLWWLLEFEGRPAGCALLNPSPEQDAIELVYLGLVPEARGHGLARLLLRHAIARARTQPARWITCAVDRRNAPARGLYADAGFEPFTERVALVRAAARG